MNIRWRFDVDSMGTNIQSFEQLDHHLSVEDSFTDPRGQTQLQTAGVSIMHCVSDRLTDINSSNIKSIFPLYCLSQHHYTL